MSNTDFQHRLAALPPHCATAFAAACCERLLPFLDTMAQAQPWPNAGRYRAILDEIWLNAQSKGKHAIPASYLDECFGLLPQHHKCGVAHRNLAQGCLGTLNHALQCARNTAPHGAYYCSMTVLAIAYQYLQAIDPLEGVPHSDFDIRVQNAPLTLREKQFMEQALSLLEKKGKKPQAIIELQHMAQTDRIAPMPLG